jgi:hypothetical protein
MENVSPKITLGIQRQVWEGVKVFACAKCKAPGRYSDNLWHRDGGQEFGGPWPKCYNPELAGQLVGSHCPQCGAKRPENRDLGELSSSIPKFVWKMILGFKWCLVHMFAFRQQIKS